MLNKAVKELKNKKISRRKFLELGGRATLASWLSIPLISSLGRIITAFTEVGHGPTAELKKISHQLHPEVDLLILTLSNIIFVQKEQWLMEKMDDKPHLATIIGAEHCGIENEIQSPKEKRIEFLERLSPILPLVVSPLETFYQIAIFDFDSKNWQTKEILEVPELKELLYSL